MNTNRRNFLRKSAFAIGASAIVGASGNIISSNSGFNPSNLNNDEQVKLLNRFEKWVNDYIEVVEKEKLENREFKNNLSLTSLPDELAKWMPELKQLLSDKQFATEYLKVSQKLTQTIDSRF